MTAPHYYRQGDVSLFPVTTKFAGKNQAAKGRAVLAHGEATGHAHVLEHPRVHFTTDAEIVAALRQELVDKGILLPDADTVTGAVVVAEPTLWRHGDLETGAHPDHGPQTIAPGHYAVLREREYTPQAIRRVED